MNIIQEIEDMRKRMLQEINAEFDRIIESVSKNMDNLTAETVPYAVQYPLTAGSGIFKGKKPVAVIIEGESYDVKTWKELVKAIMDKCTESKENIIKLYELVGKISGKKRVLLAMVKDDMRSPIEITKHMYMETHYDTETLLNILVNRILMPIGYDVRNISVVIRNE